MKLENQNIFITSAEPWGDVWYSKHIYAYALAKKNNVFFINPPNTWRPSHFFFNRITIRKYSDTLHVISLKNHLPLTGKIGFLLWINERLKARKLKQFLIRNKLRNSVFWLFDPFGFHHTEMAGASLSIYHVVDDYSGFSKEKRVADSCDMVICIYKKLAPRYQNLSQPMLVVSHGILPPGLDLDQIFNYPVHDEILFVGTVSHRLDFELFYNIAKEFREYHLKIIGPILTHTFDKNDTHFYNQLLQMENVSLDGPKSFFDLQKDILSARLCIAPYKMNLEYTIGALKIIHYLSYGKEVISTSFHDYQQTLLEHPDLFRMTDTSEDFIEQMKLALSQTSTDRNSTEQRFNFVKSYYIENRISAIEDFINKTKHSY